MRVANFPTVRRAAKTDALAVDSFFLNGSIGSQTLDDWPRYIGQLRILNCSSQKITVE